MGMTISRRPHLPNGRQVETDSAKVNIPLCFRLVL